MASTNNSNPPLPSSSSAASPPNPVIPPRTSSTGLYRSSLAAAVASGSGTSNNHHNNGTSASPSSTSPPQSFSQPAPLPSVLNTVSEGDWLGLSRHQGHGQNHSQDQHHQDQHSYQFQRQPTPRGLLAIGGSGHASTMQHHYTPPQQSDPSRYAHENLEFTAQRSWTDNKEKVVRAPFDYVSSHPGKDFRAQLINAFNALLEVPPDRLEIITRAVGMLHESSLLVDDVQDSSELRRGYPVAHNIFGVPQTINSANYIYFVALQELQTMNNPKIISMFAEELVNLHRGQGMDLFWRDTLTCPTEDDYLEMVGNKTGGLFRLGIKLMQAESTTSVDCVPLVNLVGLIFQIRDDYMNLSSSEYSDNKGLCEDLTEGKFSFPVIHSIRSNPANMQLINILKQRPTDVQVKRYAVSYMESTGSFEYTRSVIAILIERARKLAQEMDGGVGKAAGVQKILDMMVVT